MELLDKIIKYIKREHPEIYIMDTNYSDGSIELYLDTDYGIDINECVNISNELLANYPELGDYMLMVSSPGLDKPLKYEFQFRRNIGRQLDIYNKETGRKLLAKLIDVNFPVIKIETLKLRGKALVKDKEMELTVNDNYVIKLKI